MESWQKYAEAFREVTEEEALAAAEESAIRRALFAGRRRTLPWWLAVAGVAVATAVVAFVVIPADQPWAAARRGGCIIVSGDTIRAGSGCDGEVLLASDARIQMTAGTELRREPNRVRLARGRARFVVRPRTGSVFRVAVSGGEIRVLGTIFEVEERGSAGRVRLDEGRIELATDDGDRRVLSPGEVATWGSAPSAVPSAPDEPFPAIPKRRPRDGFAMTVDQVMQRQFQLRSQGRAEELIELLTQASRAPSFTREQRERFSFALGEALEAARRVEQACRHWMRHRQRFGADDAAVRERLARCAQ